MDLIDHPVELGNIGFLSFEAADIPYHIALSGSYRPFDRDRLVSDIRRIYEAELATFPGPAPFDQYLFLLHVGDSICNGLEHIDSTALLADRSSLPPFEVDAANDAYTQLFGLFSHECFHAWNVKSVEPEAFVPCHLDREDCTEQLRAFGGITSYYDDLLLARSNCISPEACLNLPAQGITRVQQTKGRLKQTLAESSLTAWNKFYRQDENSPNAIVSYYQKGASATLCLDLLVQSKSTGRHSLSSIMRQHYHGWCAARQGIPEEQWQVRCQEITGLSLGDFFQTALYSTRNLPLAECLATAGVALAWRALPHSHGGGSADAKTDSFPSAPDSGARLRQDGDGTTLTHVFSDGSAENATLYLQDKIIALNGFACTDLALQWSQQPVGSQVHIHFFRTGVLHETIIIVEEADAETALLAVGNRRLLEQ